MDDDDDDEHAIDETTYFTNYIQNRLYNDVSLPDLLENFDLYSDDGKYFCSF